MSTFVQYSLTIILALSVSFAQNRVKVTPNVNYTGSYILWTPSKTPVKTSLKNLSKGEQMLIQIFLDEHDFGPGILDGAIRNFPTNIA